MLLLVDYKGYKRIEPRAFPNGRNVVGQQLPKLLDVTCCVRLHTLLHAVACCCAKFETGTTSVPTTLNIYFVPWSPKRSATMLDPLIAQLLQHCWGHARALHMISKVLGDVSFPRCTAGPNIVGSCWIRLYSTANTDEQLPTWPNSVGSCCAHNFWHNSSLRE